MLVVDTAERFRQLLANNPALKTPNMNQQCKVCNEPAAGFHFGAFTCEGCKSFFGRTYNNLSSISECKNNGGCVINKKNRTSCKACRLRKCLMVGMSKSGSRYGRRSNWFKIHCLLQEQSNLQPLKKEEVVEEEEIPQKERRYTPPSFIPYSPLHLRPPSHPTVTVPVYRSSSNLHHQESSPWSLRPPSPPAKVPPQDQPIDLSVKTREEFRLLQQQQQQQLQIENSHRDTSLSPHHRHLLLHRPYHSQLLFGQQPCEDDTRVPPAPQVLDLTKRQAITG